MSLLDTFAHLDWAQVLQLTWQHIMLVGVAVGLAIIVGVPLGILMTRFPAVAGPLQASATVLLTIPSIALFGLLLPFYSRFGQGLKAAAGDHCGVPLLTAADHAQHLPGFDQRRTRHP